MRLKDKTVIITGAAGGIGEATALLFAEQGAKLTLTDIQEEAGQQLATNINQNGGSAQFIAANISQEAAVKEVFQKHLETYGSLDVLVNNAGIEGPMGFIHQTSSEDWKKLLEVNQSGLFFGLQQAIQVMMESGNGGSIVNTASVAGVGQAAGMGAYGATKHAVVGLTRSAAVEYAKFGIRVNAICPGVIDTAMTRRGQEAMPDLIDKVKFVIPMRRVGKPIEIANAILFMASDESSYMTGQTLVVDGGMKA